MRPTFMGFEASKSAIFTNQKALDIVGNNLANLDTNGYTRQRVDRTSVYPGSYTARVGSSRVGLTGQGVDTIGVSQMRDSFLDKRFRDEYSKSSYHSQSEAILGDIQSALGDGHNITDEAGLYGSLKQIGDALNNFMQAATVDSESNLVMSAFRNITQVLQQMDAKLTNVAKQQTEDMQIGVDRVNEIFKQIDHLNEMISKDSTVTIDPDNEYFKPNELLDKRNLLLDELASYGNINVTSKSDGKVTVEMGGHSVVSVDGYTSMNMQKNDDGTVSLNWKDSGENVQLTGGALLSYQQFINGRGSHIKSNNETMQQGIPYYRDRLNTFAAALANAANNVVPTELIKEPLLDENGNKVQEKDKDGNLVFDDAGQPVYKMVEVPKDFKKLISSVGDGTEPITAANITLSEEWVQGGSGYFIFNNQEYQVKYAQKLSHALLEDSYSFNDFGESFSGTFAEYEVDFIGKLGADIAYQQGRFESTGMVADDFMSRRDSISGVSRDEETAEMLRYQKSYEAAARMMTTMDEVLDVLINRTGRVGL